MGPAWSLFKAVQRNLVAQALLVSQLRGTGYLLGGLEHSLIVETRKMENPNDTGRKHTQAFSEEFRVYVHNLAPSVDNYRLRELFAEFNCCAYVRQPCLRPH